MKKKYLISKENYEWLKHPKDSYTDIPQFPASLFSKKGRRNLKEVLNIFDYLIFMILPVGFCIAIMGILKCMNKLPTQNNQSIMNFIIIMLIFGGFFTFFLKQKIEE